MKFRQILRNILRRLAFNTPWFSPRLLEIDYQGSVDQANLEYAQVEETSLPGWEDRIDPSGLPRLFYVSPLPPDQSGIANYSLALLPELGRYFDLVLIHPGLSSVTVEEEQDLQVRSPSWMLSHVQPQDTVIYHIGNSPFHTHMLGLMDKVPGVVVLHDVYLGHLFFHEVSVNQNRELFVEHLYGSHGNAGLQVFQHLATSSERVLDYPCSGRVVSLARHVFVYSNHARQLIAQHYGNSIADKVSVLNMPVHRPTELGEAGLQRQTGSARLALGIPETTWLVCCFGIVQASKRSLEIIEAWVALGWHLDPDKKLVFVGGCTPGFPYSQRVLAQIDALPLDQRNVEVLGWVNDAQYNSYLQACSLAVQLRADSRGETSAALLNTLACGVPTLINAHGAMAEIPGEVVHKIPDQFTPQELQAALQQLHQDPVGCASVGLKAAQHIQTCHDPAMLVQQMASLLIEPPVPAAKRFVAWVDCSALFIEEFVSPAERVELRAAFWALARYPHAAIHFQFVRYCVSNKRFEPFPQAHGLLPGGLADVFSRQASQLETPAVLLLNKRAKWFTYFGVRALKSHKPQVVYFEPSEFNTAVKLCDQLVQASFLVPGAD